MRVIAYLHGSKEAMRNLGERSGLSGAVLDRFMYACYEVKVELEVNEKTGKADIVSVDDRFLLQPITPIQYGTFGDK